MPQISASSSSAPSVPHRSKIFINKMEYELHPLSDNYFTGTVDIRPNVYPQMNVPAKFTINSKAIKTSINAGAPHLNRLFRTLQSQFQNESGAIIAKAMKSLGRLDAKSQTLFFQALYLYSLIAPTLYKQINMATSGHASLKDYADMVGVKPARLEEHAQGCDDKYNYDDFQKIMENQFKHTKEVSRTLLQTIHSLNNCDNIHVTKGVSTNLTERKGNTAVDPKRFLQACIAGHPVVYRTHISTSLDINRAKQFTSNRTQLNIKSTHSINRELCGYLDLTKPDLNTYASMLGNISAASKEWQPNIILIMQTKSTRHFPIANYMFHKTKSNFQEKPSFLNEKEWGEVLMTYNLERDTTYNLSNTENEILINPALFQPQKVFALENFNTFIVQGDLIS